MKNYISAEDGVTALGGFCDGPGVSITWDANEFSAEAAKGPPNATCDMILEATMQRLMSYMHTSMRESRELGRAVQHLSAAKAEIHLAKSKLTT